MKLSTEYVQLHSLIHSLERAETAQGWQESHQSYTCAPNAAAGDSKLMDEKQRRGPEHFRLVESWQF